MEENAGEALQCDVLDKSWMRWFRELGPGLATAAAGGNSASTVCELSQVVDADVVRVLGDCFYRACRLVESFDAHFSTTMATAAGIYYNRRGNFRVDDQSLVIFRAGSARARGAACVQRLGDMQDFFSKKSCLEKPAMFTDAFGSGAGAGH